jgi:YgiT-type zinc finger domain-containing protein
MTGKHDADVARCPLCGGSLEAGRATLPFVRGERVITIRDVPAEVCGDCGEAYLSGPVTDAVQDLVQKLEALDSEVSVARFHAA